MPVNILNRSGPLSFKSETNNSENLSINSLLSNVYNPGSNNFSISQSYYQLQNRIGNSNSDSSTINITKPLGVGFINKDNRRPIKFSEFYGASYISSSFSVAASTGVATVKIYSPSVVQNNNFLTNNIQDKVYQYTLYSKSTITTPIADSGWNKMFSYAKSGDNIESFYNLINTKAYKLVSKDCLSNAFTSSMFIGTCTSTVVDNTTYTYTMSAADLPTASSLLFQKINGDKTTNGYTNTKITDLSNILNNLNSLLQNPNITTYKSSGQLLPVISYKDNLGYNRTLSFDGLILQKSATPDGSLGYFYTGLVTATSSGGTNPTYQYSFENTSTFGQITLYILGDQDSSASSCTTPPTPATVGNFPTNISFTGPRCGYLDCGVGYTQPVCNPTSTTQIKHSGSFIITNNNNAEMLATISSTWTNLDGTALNSLISTVGFTPTGMFSISANSTRKISIGFGLSNYENTIQPKTFTAKGSVDLVLPLGYSPQSQTCEIIANFDKNSCVISPITPPVVTPVTSNVGCITYNGAAGQYPLENWPIVKTKIINKINIGTGSDSDKLITTSVINAIDNTSCTLPTTIASTRNTIYKFQGRVDHTLRITLTGLIYTYSNEQYHGALSKSSTFYNGGIPSNSNTITLKNKTGRGTVTISQQPTLSNSYTCIIDIFDSNSGEDTYTFELEGSQNITLEWVQKVEPVTSYHTFSGEYDVKATHPILGTKDFIIEFNRFKPIIITNNFQNSGVGTMDVDTYIYTNSQVLSPSPGPFFVSSDDKLWCSDYVSGQVITYINEFKNTTSLNCNNRMPNWVFNRKIKVPAGYNLGYIAGYIRPGVLVTYFLSGGTDIPKEYLYELHFPSEGSTDVTATIVKTNIKLPDKYKIAGQYTTYWWGGGMNLSTDNKLLTYVHNFTTSTSSDYILWDYTTGTTITSYNRIQDNIDSWFTYLGSLFAAGGGLSNKLFIYKDIRNSSLQKVSTVALSAVFQFSQIPQVNFFENPNYIKICQIGGVSSVVTPVTSNLGCVNYNSSMLESWTQIKSRTVVIINSKIGTSANKTFAKSVVNALPNTGCTLPTTISQDGYTINISWTVDSAGGQSYVCTTGTSGQFSGTYTVVTTNAILGNANFYILFLRKNNDNPDAESYINLCQTG